MGNEEYKEIMNELYKFLRDKISISLGEHLTDEAKEKLFSFDFESNIVIDPSSNKIVEYKVSDNGIHVSDEFLTPEYIEKVKEKNPEFDLADLKNRVNAESPKVLLEELIAFSPDLKITEKDIVKSLFIQEMLKMILMNEEMDAKEDAIMTGTIELLAHNIGSKNGFLVSTPKKYEAELDVALGLKEELEDKFEEIVLKGNVLDHLSRIENSRLLQKINELADDRRIIDSTQNLDSVIDSIVNMTKENEEIINNEEPQVEKEEIIEIIDTPKEEVKEEPVEMEVKEEVKEVNNEVSTEVSNEVNTEIKPKTSHKRALIYVIVTVLTVVLGVLIGYLLFKYK